jgi:hypothetical protein
MIRREEWRPADGITLEPNALRAVQERARNVVVAAGPGAGKTELLAQRADFLLTTGGCLYPKRILAISFKVHAARKPSPAQRCSSDARDLEPPPVAQLSPPVHPSRQRASRGADIHDDNRAELLDETQPGDWYERAQALMAPKEQG